MMAISDSNWLSQSDYHARSFIFSDQIHIPYSLEYIGLHHSWGDILCLVV